MENGISVDLVGGETQVLPTHINFQISIYMKAQKIIVALDYTNPLDALEMAAKLRGHVDGFKTNHTLWSQSVYIKDYTDGHELFVDCKLWDTPNTVKQVLQKIVDKGATMATISTFNNNSVFEEVKEFADKIKLLGVSYLTSWNAEEQYELYNDLPEHMWRKSIERIKNVGFSGIICSPHDIPTINLYDRSLLRVCPGIKYNQELKGQSRTVTPKLAQQLGADYLIIGRSITHSKDPIKTISDIRNSLNIVNEQTS